MKLLHGMTAVAIACLLAASPAKADDMKGGMGHHMMGPGCCEKNLPPEKAKLVEGAMHQTMEKNHKMFGDIRALHEKMRAIATADTFDKKAFLKTADQMAAVQAKMERNRAQMMASVAEKLTAEERRAMAKCMAENFHRGDFEHKGWGHHGMMHRDMEGGPRGEAPQGAAPANSHNDYGTLNK